MSVLLLDNYDSFTYNLYDYLIQAGADCFVLRNDALPPADLEQIGCDAIVLSPGPKRPADAGNMMKLIDARHRNTPVLGICLGHQALGEFFGASLVKAREPVHGKTTLIRHNGHPLFQDIPPEFAVMRYHSLVLEAVTGTPLDCIAQSADGAIMAIAHRSLPLLGVQFHPESILSEFGLQLLKNWIKLANLPHQSGPAAPAAGNQPAFSGKAV